MIVILTCRGYTAEASVIDGNAGTAADLCLELELQAYRLTGETYARLAREEGRIVADADGPRGDQARAVSVPWTGEHAPDAASQTGMYDRD